MTNSYLFYDIETTGLNKAFDQVLQFAAIRTDPELNEIDRHAVELYQCPSVDDDLDAEALNEGFEFHNPNIKEMCGCGESFSV